MARTIPGDSSKYREAIVSGPIITVFLRLGLPLLFVRLVQDIYGIVDAFWLSRYNQFAMAVPRQVWPVYSLFSSFVMSFASANLAILSQYVGAKMYDNINDVVSKMLSISIASGTISGALFYSSSRYIFKNFVATPNEILDHVLLYSYIMSIDIVLLSLNLTISVLIQSIGDTKTSAFSQMVGALTNVVLDPVLIMGFSYIPPMGTAGAALATVLSKIVSIIILMERLFERYSWIKLRISFSIDKDYLKLALRIATPLLIMNISNTIAFNLQNRLINTFGVIATTAVSIGFIVFDLANTSLWGLTESIAIMVGQNLGANNRKRARKIAITTSLFIFLSVFATSIIVYFVRNNIVSIFITGENVPKDTIEMIYNEVEKFLTITIWTLAFFALTFSAMSVGRGSGHTLMPTVINMIRLWGIRIGMGYILGVVAGLATLGIYIAFALSNIVGGLLSFLWIYRGSWSKPIVKKEFKI
ncbi:MAG: MATE family efflux transporter [Ignisphaera sp.]